MSEMFSLRGKTVVVTGAVGHYGLPFARGLAEAGARVVLTSREADRAATAAQELLDAGFDAIGMALDLGDPRAIERFCDELPHRAGKVDVLVNNAVHRAGGTLSETSVEDWAATTAVNSTGLFYITKLVSEGMVERGRGSIINIGSIYGIVAPNFSIYEGTEMTMPAFYSFDKAGMIGFTRYLAAWLGPRGVRVNCLCPGGLFAAQELPFVQAYERTVPLGRLARAEDVLGALVFLASDASEYVTGVTLPVDGGWTAR